MLLTKTGSNLTEMATFTVVHNNANCFHLFHLSYSSEVNSQRVREYLMNYRRPGFLALVLFDFSPAPSPLSRQVVSFLFVAGRAYIDLIGGAKSYDVKKAWSSLTKIKTRVSSMPR